MNLRVNKSVAVGDVTSSIGIEVQNLDQVLDSNSSLFFGFVEMLIDKVFSDSVKFVQILPSDSETLD